VQLIMHSNHLLLPEQVCSHNLSLNPEKKKKVTPRSANKTE
jgi:hypothetical protein